VTPTIQLIITVLTILAQITIATFTTCCTGLVTMLAGVGTATIAIYSLRSQQQQELKRASQQREWQEKDQIAQRAAAVEDRNMRRKWDRSDRQIDQRKEYLIAKKSLLEVYINRMLRIATLAAKKAGLPPEENAELEGLIASLPNSHFDISFSMMAIGDRKLAEEFQKLLHANGEFINAVPVTDSAKPFDEKLLADTSTTLAVQAAATIKRLEEIVIENLDDKSWE
jgi:hypothetical protein